MRVIRFAVLALIVVLCVLLVQQAAAAPPRELLAVELRHSSQVVAFFDHRGKWLRATRHERCSGVPWTRSCLRARALYLKHRAAARRLHRALWLHLPSTRDWLTAVTVAQRVYPGTERWLLSCSSSEGGHGTWVLNNQGSGVGGWMQMYPSTFWRMYGAMLPDARSRGFTVPPSTASWYSPLGQALASAWGVSNGRRGEWAGSGC